MTVVNKGGRPKKEAYRKLMFRYSRVEDTLLAAISKMTNDTDKQIILDTLEELKQSSKQEVK